MAINDDLREALLDAAPKPLEALRRDLLDTSRDASEDPVVDARRWEHLGIFFGLTCASQFAWIMYSAAPATAAAGFGATAGQVTFVSTIYPLLYLPGCVLAARATKRGGLRGAMREASAWMAAGASVKVGGSALGWFLKDGAAAYGCVVLGQALMALGQPHLVNAPAQLAQEWFPASERETAATAGLLGNIVGQALGEALSPLVCSATAGWLGDRGALTVLAGASLLPVGACGLWCARRFRPSPNPPKLATSSLWRDWRQLLGDAHFRRLFFAFCVGLGVFNALLAMVAQWLAPCGYSATTAGALGATFVLVGVPCAALVALRLDATRDYKGYVKRVAGADLAFTALLCVAATRGAAPALYVAFGCLGGSIVATSAVVMETAVEATYPTSPEVPTGLLFCAGNTLSIASIYAIQFLLELQGGACEGLSSVGAGHHAPVALFLLANIFLCFLLLVTYDGPLRRLDAERAHAVRRSTDTLASLAPRDFDDLAA